MSFQIKNTKKKTKHYSYIYCITAKRQKTESVTTVIAILYNTSYILYSYFDSAAPWEECSKHPLRRILHNKLKIK